MIFVGMVFSSSFAELTAYELDPSVHDTVVDWTADSSYKGGKAPEDPTTACVIIDQITAKVDASNFADLAKIAQIWFKNGDYSKCIIDTGAGTLTTPGAFFGDGWLVKKGEGTLVLTSNGRIVSSSGAQDGDRNCYIDIQEGTLDDRASRASGITKVAIRNLNIAAGATLILAKNVETLVNRVLSGAGTVLAPPENDKNATRFMPRYPNKPQEFSGVISTNIRFYCSANLTLSNTNSLMDGAHIIDGGSTLAQYDGFLSLKKFGLDGQPSSLGTAKTIALQEGGARLRYVGQVPDVCDKEFKLVHSSASSGNVQSVIDGGPYGALTLSGSIHPDSYRNNQRLWLGGSNANECVISGSITSYTYNNNKGVVTTNRIHVTKTGTGTWRLAHNDSRDGISGVTVKNGVLSFDTLGEIGEKCSFGTGRMPDGSVAFYPDRCEPLDPAYVMPYQFLLGDAAAETIGTLALASPTGCVCLTRPIGVVGNGAISNGHENVRMALADVSPCANDGAKTLYLDGVSTSDNMILDITNDVNRQLTVVKRGPGKWILSGDQTFGGALRVEGGELVVRKTPAKQPFSWFRLVLKENWGEYTNGALCDYWAKSVFVIDTAGFALYDVDGNKLSAGCTTDAPDYASLNENEVAYANAQRKNLEYPNKGVSFGQMIAGSYRWVGGLTRPYLANPSTWVTMDLRLPAGSQVAAVDFKPMFGYDHKQITKWEDRSQVPYNCWNYCSNIKYFNMYGSTDGVRWEPLFDKDVYCEGTNYVPSVWYYGDGYTNGVVRGLKFDHVVSSRPAATVLTNDMAVAVSGGGTLRVEGSPITVASLGVDASSGGTISNVTFAANGTLVVPNLPDEDDITLPGTYQDVTGFEYIAATWKLDAGEKSRRYTIVNRNGVLHLIKKGLLIIVR